MGKKKDGEHFSGESRKKRLLGRRRSRWGDNIKRYLKEYERVSS